MTKEWEANPEFEKAPLNFRTARTGFERYDPNNLEHQEPVIPISESQEFNDLEGDFSTACKLDFEHLHPPPPLL